MTTELVRTSDTSNLEIIQQKICVIRDVQVMLDRDLAELYQVELRVFNQAVRRNLNRFPDNFMFEVDKDEIRPLITNCDLSEKMRYWPQKSMVFTEQGIAMLSAVLRSEVAIATSIRIMNAFVAMRRTLASMGHMLTRLDAVERRQITDQTKNEARFDEIFAKMSEGEIPLHHRQSEGNLLDGSVAQRRETSYFRGRQTWRGNDSRSHCPHPQGHKRAQRVQRKTRMTDKPTSEVPE